MSTVEKTRLRDTLSLYTDEHPVFETISAQTFLSVLMESRRFPLYATLTALLVFGSGTATLAAEESAPGDTFYSIKIHVNEPLMSALSPSTEGKARVSAQRASRRVDEVVLLASSGRLTEEKQQYLDTEFSKEVENTKTHTDTLTKRGDRVLAEDVRADFTARLSGEAQALGAVQGATPEKTKIFLRKILAISEEDSNEHENTRQTPEQIEGTSEERSSERTALLRGTTTSSSVHKRKSGLVRTEDTARVRTLRVTASTTLQRIFENSTPAVTPKTDRAIQTTEQESQAPGNTELRIDR